MEHAYTHIARLTNQTSDFAGNVVVINYPTFLSRRVLTYRARTKIFFYKPFVVLFRQSIVRFNLVKLTSSFVLSLMLNTTHLAVALISAALCTAAVKCGAR